MEESLKKTLVYEAVNSGICKDGLRAMMGMEGDGLVGYYVQMIDWCLENDFPKLETLKESFRGCEDKGVYIGREFNGETFDKLQAYIFHDCKGTINVAMDYDNAVIPMLYFANGCDVTVECVQRNAIPIRVPIYSFGENSIKAVDNNNIKYRTYRA